jgi:putative SOS response-associated peptidase YedK
MWGRYYFTESDYDEARDELELELSEAARAAAVGEIFPGGDAPVVATAKSGRPGCFAMRWGYRLPDGRMFINGRAETADERALYRQSAAERRCLLPARRYFEWSGDKGAKQKFSFAAPDGGLLYLGGLYRPAGGGTQFVVLTRAALGPAADIHSRMPLLLPPAAARAWLDRALPFRGALALCATPPLACARE